MELTKKDIITMRILTVDKGVTVVVLFISNYPSKAKLVLLSKVEMLH